jgi:acyl-coenzyme A thioesterase PaaI-like protein
MELGLRTVIDGDTVRGYAEIVPEACVPGTDTVRTSVLATWADVAAGIVAGHAVNPRIPLTLDLEVHIQAAARSGGRVVVVANAVKVGRTVVVCEAAFHDEQSGQPIALALASFIASPDPSHVFEGGFPLIPPTDQRLTIALAERIGSRVLEPGTAEVPWRPDGLNASGAIQGGLVAFAAEAAAMSLVDYPTIVQAMNVRYLRPFTTGPATAVATGDGVMSLVRLTDSGAGKLGAIATVRLGDPSGPPAGQVSLRD